MEVTTYMAIHFAQTPVCWVPHSSPSPFVMRPLSTLKKIINEFLYNQIILRLNTNNRKQKKTHKRKQNLVSSVVKLYMTVFSTKNDEETNKFTLLY